VIARERPADGDALGALILHHGRGTDEHDLLGLADVLDPVPLAAEVIAAFEAVLGSV